MLRLKCTPVDKSRLTTRHSATAKAILRAYHKKIGGKPVFQPKAKASATKKRGAKRGASEDVESPAPAPKKRGRKKSTNAPEDSEAEDKWQPPEGSWEDDVSHVMSIMEEESSATGKGAKEKKLVGFVAFKDDHKTKAPLPVLRQKCPQALLTYYEQHL